MQQFAAVNILRRNTCICFTFCNSVSNHKIHIFIFQSGVQFYSSFFARKLPGCFFFFAKKLGRCKRDCKAHVRVAKHVATLPAAADTFLHVHCYSCTLFLLFENKIICRDRMKIDPKIVASVFYLCSLPFCRGIVVVS